MNTAESIEKETKSEEIEADIIDLFVRMAGALKLPRSLGEIYGALFVANDPMSMSDLIERLHLSKGSMSQGLRILKDFGAVKSVYIQGERKDYYVAERELRALARGFLQGQVIPHLDSGSERIEFINEAAMQTDDQNLQARVRKLKQWHSRAKKTMPIMYNLLKLG